MAQKPLIGFVGQGWIGKNYADDFERRGFQTVRYALEEPYVRNREKIKACDFVFIAVPTPTTPAGFDYSIVRSSLGYVGKGKTAIIKSTIVPGTTKSLQDEHPDITVVYSPEFLSEATAAHDAAYPFMNIVGLTRDSVHQKDIAAQIHGILPKAAFSQTCSSTEAEIIKYSHNGSGYTQILFFNIMFDLAIRHGCNWHMIQRAIEADPLVNNRYARPVHKSGRGAGGGCFIKDVAALRAEYAADVDDPEGAALLEAMERKNIALLRGTGKDLDLLAGVYGEGVLAESSSPIAMPHVSALRGDVRVLVCTEAVDRTHPLLGYFHGWVKECARHAHTVHTVSLGYGERALPGNVTEHSLGKESMSGGSRFLRRILYTARFLPLVFRIRREYDKVLVHLSSEFVIIGMPLWKMMGKRVGFWYNAEYGTLFGRIAIRLADVVFYSNQRSYAAQFPHARYMPTAVDTEMYALESDAPKDTILSLGRMTEKKNLDALIGAFREVRQNDQHLTLDIYGEPHVGDEAYAAKIRESYASLEKEGALVYRGPVSYEDTPAVYAAHNIFVHAGSARGSNKTLYEAMAAGCIVVTGEEEVRHVVDERLFVEKPTVENIARAIRAALSLSREARDAERAKMRAYVRREHGLSSVVPTMLEMLYRAGGEMSHWR